MPFVTSFVLAKKSPGIFIQQNTPDSLFQSHLIMQDLNQKANQIIFETIGKIVNLTSAEDGSAVGFMVNADTSKNSSKTYDQYVWFAYKSSKLQKTRPEGITKDWICAEDSKNYFSKDGSQYFFGVMPAPQFKDTTLLESEVVDIEIWNYQDQVLYTQQEVEAKDELKRSYLSLYDCENQSFAQLANQVITTIIPHPEIKLDVALGVDDQSQRMMMSWEGRTYQDLYLVHLSDGHEEKIATGITGKLNWSPGGKYIYWYEETDTTWYAYDLAFKRQINLTRRKKIFSDELNDRPDHPSSYGMMGWSKNDEIVYLYDRYDIWKINPKDPLQQI